MWANYCKGRTCHTYRFQGALAVNHLGQTVGTYLDHNMVQLHAAGNGRFDHIYWRCKGQIFGPDENGLVGVAICNGVNFRPDIRCRSCGSFRDQGAKALNEGQVLIGDYEGMSKIMYYPPTWRIVGTDADEEGEG
jgi:hypothetical protein